MYNHDNRWALDTEDKTEMDEESLQMTENHVIFDKKIRQCVERSEQVTQEEKK